MRCTRMFFLLRGSKRRVMKEETHPINNHWDRHRHFHSIFLI